MIIFGTRGITRTRDRGTFFCPQCNRQRSYHHKGVRQFFTLYFIPVIPSKQLSEYVECQACQGTYSLDVLQYDPAAARARMRSHFCETLKQVMVQVLLADESIDDNEVQTVLNVFRQVSEQDLTEGELRTEIQRAEASPEQTLTRLSEMSSFLADNAKETIIKAALLVASADGAIDANERELIQHIAAAIEMSPAHMRGVLAEMHDEEEEADRVERRASLLN